VATKLYNLQRGTAKLAFLKRAYLRTTGRWPNWGVDVESRATQWLMFLENPSSSLGWRVELENLAFQIDLLLEEEALIDECLQLQLRVLELANEYEVVAEIRDGVMGCTTPMNRLVSAMIQQAIQGGASEIWVAFTRDRANQFREEYSLSEPPPAAGRDVASVLGLPSGPEVYYLTGDGFHIAMMVPKNLSKALRGAFERIAAASQAGLLDRLVKMKMIPEGLEFTWVFPDLVKVDIAHARVPTVA
jgi:hypothetical protein